MARTIPTTEPLVLIGGDSWSWTKVLATYPPSEGWTLGYSIRGIVSLADAKVVVTSSGSVYTIAVAAADTLPLSGGAYQWQSYVTGTGAFAGQRWTVDNGIFTIVPALSSLTGSQGQTHAERTLYIIEAKIEGRLSADLENYSIMGRAISKIPTDKLLRYRAIYQEKVRRLNNRGSISTPVLAVMGFADNSIGTSEPVVLPPWFRALES